jgi:hypothetical protein
MSSKDHEYLQLAIEQAKKGKGFIFLGLELVLIVI